MKNFGIALNNIKKKGDEAKIKAKESIASFNIGRYKDIAKDAGLGTAMFLGGISFGAAVVNTIVNCGAIAASTSVVAVGGFYASAIKIADKYFRKQLLNNTMDEAAEKAYKAICLTIKGLLEQGKSEKEIIKILGELDDKQTQLYAELYVGGVNNAEKSSAYRIR